MRWSLVSLSSLAGLVVLALAALVVLQHSLDQPWIKRRIQALARTSAGVEIDYADARIALLSGAEIEGLVVQSPAEVRPFAPDLLRVGHVDATWSLGSLLLGHGPRVGRVRASEVTLTVVVDENGRTSFDALPPSAPTPTVPLSQQASKFLGTAPAVGQIDVDRVTLALVQITRGSVSDRTELHGLALTLVARSAEPAARGWRVHAALGSPASPLDLGLTRAGTDAGTARARLWFTVDATALDLTAVLDLRMVEQSFVASVSADRWLHAEASARFDPGAGQTRVTLDHTETGDGAASAEAAMDLPDVGAPVVLRARGDVDLAKLLAWLPVGLVPVSAERARVRCEINSLIVGPIVHLSERGTVAVDVDTSNVVVHVSSGSLHVGEGTISLRAKPAAGGGIGAEGSAKLAGTRLRSGEDDLAADDLAVDIDGQQMADATIAGRIGLRFASFERGGASPIVVRGGQVELRVQGLHVDSQQPLATRGDLALHVELASLDAGRPGTRAILDGLTARVHTALDGHPPYAIEMQVQASRLRVTGPDGRVLADAPARFEGAAHDVQPDAFHPAASRGVVRAAVEVGDLRASLDATKATDAIDFAVRAGARSLKALRPMLPPSLSDRAPWDRMAVTVRSTGRVERLGGGAPAIRHTTQVDVERFGFANLAASSLSVTLKSQGTALQHQVDVDLRALGLTLDGSNSSDDHLTLTVTVDRLRPSLQFQLATEGRAATTLSGAASFDRARRAVPYTIAAHLGGLAALAPFAAKVGLDGLDLSRLDVDFSTRGALLGAVVGVSRDGAIELDPSFLRTASVEGNVDLRALHLRWAKGDTAVVTPSLAWHGDLHTVGGRRTLDSKVEIGTLHLDLGSRDVDLNGISDETRAAVVGNLVAPEIELAEHFSVRAVEQNVVPEYPVGDLALALSADRSAEGVVHISDMKVTNGLGGTTFAATGNVDLAEERRTLSVTTSIAQDLGRLSTIPERFKGRGKVSVEANITSPDFLHYRVRAAVKGEDVTIALARAGIDVDTANGEVPITVALAVGAHGIALERSEKRSPYSMLRFADQHPLLTRSGFLSITRLKTPFVSIAPLVGNLEIEQNVVSLRQFEMGVRGGSITGQCGIDWDGPRSTLELHVRANGVQSSHGEPFDGNIAVAISAADRTVDGRAEILRIGERHLLDLLDLQDPMHLDPAMNRIRGALRFGYPDSVRLVFDHGFVSAHVELGGLARLISIGELRGIPMGPIFDKMLAPVLEGLDTKETP